MSRNVIHSALRKLHHVTRRAGHDRITFSACGGYVNPDETRIACGLSEILILPNEISKMNVFFLSVISALFCK